MTFKSAYLRLTLFYVLIVMVISVSFSVVLYNLSSQELERGLRQQTRLLRERPSGGPVPVPIQELEKIRTEQLEMSNNHLQANLIYFNLLILVLSSVISYLLAKRTLRPIKEMVEAQNRFIADASHELRTPLTAMRSEIEVGLRDKKMDLAEAKKLLNSNLEEVSKLESLSSALLELAKGRQVSKLEFEEVPLTEVVTEALEKVKSMAQKKAIEFKTDFEKVSIRGDRQSLTELFVILLDNAIKYSPDKSANHAPQDNTKGSEIAIEIKRDHKKAIVRVVDHGIGIKSSDLPHIFDRFYRAETSRSKAGGDGYGLGLAIAKSIVELHGGEISVRSTPGRGSEFVVKLIL